MKYHHVLIKFLLPLLFIFFSYVILPAPVLHAGQIQPLTEEFAPWQMGSGEELTGICIDIVKEIQKRIGNDKEIKVFPWNRAYNMTLKKEGFALFSTARSEEREALFKWVGPLVPLKYVMFKLKDDTKIYRTLNDAKSVKAIAVTKNAISEQFLRKEGFQNLQVEIGKSGEENVQRVLSGQAQLYSIGYISGHYLVKKLHLEAEIVMTKMEPLFESTLNIAFNINTSDATISLWQMTLDEMKSDGTYDQIINNYR